MLENYLFFCYICLKLVEIQLPNPVCIELFSCMQYIAAFLGIVKNLLSYMSSVVQFGFLDNLFCWNNFNHFGVCKLHWFYQLLIYILHLSLLLVCASVLSLSLLPVFII